MGKHPATVGGCRGLFCHFIRSFALAEQVDLAEKAFHDALARRNEAQIAYLREPSIMTREAFEAAKTAEAVALEILDTMAGPHSRHDGNGAQAEGVIRAMGRGTRPIR
jgi:hypothetical protein